MDNMKKAVRLPECVICFDNIEENHKKSILGFELRAEAVLVSLISKTDVTIEKTEKTACEANQKVISMGKSFDTFLKDSQEKHEKFLGIFEKRHNIMITIELSLFGLFSAALLYLFLSNIQKADKEEVFLWKDAKELQEAGDGYREDRYVIRADNTTQNTYKYIWSVERIFKPKEK